MIKATSIGNTVIAYINGKMYQKTFDSSEERLGVYEKLVNTDESNVDELNEVIQLFKAPETSYEKQLKIEFELNKAKAKEVEDILDFMKDVKANGHAIFEVVENSLYIKGIRISTPELLIREITKALDEDNQDRVQALINFWKLCALNPDPRARFDLFKFLQNHNLRLTNSGNFIAYRTVNKFKAGDSELEKFVTQEYFRVKRWKKSVSNYTVYKSGNGYVSVVNTTANSGTVVGNLKDLYANIAELSGNVYTDAHTGTFRIKMGEPVKMDRAECDADPMQSCSRALHCGSLAFMKSNMGAFGKVGIVVLISPRDVVAVPIYDSGKMRVAKYVPVAIAELDKNGYIVDADIDTFDLELAQDTQEELEKIKNLSSTALEEYKKTEFIAADVDFTMLNSILESVVISVENANKIIENRIVKL